jgi:hypothetical protein
MKKNIFYMKLYIPKELRRTSAPDPHPEEIKVIEVVESEDGCSTEIYYDTDGDGVADRKETYYDRDSDGVYETVQVDSDLDGRYDENWEDTDGDGEYDYVIIDSDLDGKPDQTW